MTHGRTCPDALGLLLLCAQEDKYRAVCEALEVAGIKWNYIGPPNKRCVT